jgi:hypothetical protein
VSEIYPGIVGRALVRRLSGTQLQIVHHDGRPAIYGVLDVDRLDLR